MSDFFHDGHLGGYYVNGDPDTFYPNLWAWLADELHVNSVLDVGCGPGHALRWWGSEVARVGGIDGVPQSDGRIRAHDYTKGPLIEGPWDLVWSCEFVEHVEERYVPNFLATFACARYVAMTHALPGQTGHHHVNCQEAAYWVERMAEIGYVLLDAVTAEARAVAATDGCAINYFARTGLVFGRKGNHA